MNGIDTRTIDEKPQGFVPPATALQPDTNYSTALRRLFGRHDDWLIQAVEDADVRISNNNTGHGTLLAWDQIHHYATDLDRGDRHGILILNTQVNIGGNSLWCEQTFRPGEALPDRFGDVRGWRRENDPVYVESLYVPLPQALLQPPSQPVSGSGAALFICLCLGVGVLIANT